MSIGHRASIKRGRAKLKKKCTLSLSKNAGEIESDVLVKCRNHFCSDIMDIVKKY